MHGNEVGTQCCTGTSIYESLLTTMHNGFLVLLSSVSRSGIRSLLHACVQDKSVYPENIAWLVKGSVALVIRAGEGRTMLSATSKYHNNTEQRRSIYPEEKPHEKKPGPEYCKYDTAFVSIV